MPPGVPPVSEKAARFTESVIREMPREAIVLGVINLVRPPAGTGAPGECGRGAPGDRAW
jgi:hypothetical protein